MPDDRQPIPALDRPQMPKGYGVPENDESLLPWEHARDQLTQALTYWIGSTRPDGRPHAMPIWGAVVDDTVYFEGSPETRRGRNLAAHPAGGGHRQDRPPGGVARGGGEAGRNPRPGVAGRGPGGLP